ncbi:MAG: hypothetical protein MUE82_08015 [Chloroflexi bacterium]|jgi:hypothetical protein|nr:hypothetical protein [Chloroflexota bacterium]
MSKTPPFGWSLPRGYEFENLSTCASCGAEIGWYFTNKGNRSPLNRDGISHFATCPSAAVHRKPREALRAMPAQSNNVLSQAVRDEPGVRDAVEARRRRILAMVYAEPDTWSAGAMARWEDEKGIERPPSSVSAAFTTMFREGLIVRPVVTKGRHGHAEAVYRISPELAATWNGEPGTLSHAIERARLVPKPTSNRRKAPRLTAEPAGSVL